MTINPKTVANGHRAKERFLSQCSLMLHLFSNIRIIKVNASFLTFLSYSITSTIVFLTITKLAIHNSTKLTKLRRCKRLKIKIPCSLDEFHFCQVVASLQQPAMQCNKRIIFNPLKSVEKSY